MIRALAAFLEVVVIVTALVAAFLCTLKLMGENIEDIRL